MQTLGGISFSGLTITAPITEQYWLSLIGSSAFDGPNSIATSPTKEIYVAGSTNNTGNSDMILLKYTALGDLSWQRRLASVANNEARDVALDSDNNIYIVGYSTSTEMLLAKYNSSGNLQWQKTITNCRVDDGITVDNSGNIYCTGLFSDGTNNVGLIKFHANGSVAWARKLNSTAGSGDWGSSVSVDNAGNVYLVGQTYSSGGAGSSDIYLAKYSDAGTLAWQRSIGGTGGDAGNGIVTDSSGNSYIVGQVTVSGNSKLFIAKYNTSGVLQWQRTLGNAISNDIGYDIAMDATHLYVIGSTYNNVNQDALLAKYDFSGNLVWQRTVSAAGTTFPSDIGYGISIDAAGAICFAARVYNAGQANYEILVGRLPNDGSLTGNHSVYTYAVSTLDSNVSSFTSNNRSLTGSTVSTSSLNGSLVDSAANLITDPLVIVV